MQRDRVEGIYERVSEEEQVRKLQEMGAANAVPPLPVSPCVKVKSTGEIHEWSEDFANRPDLCVNCDESGNEDPAVWQNRLPSGYGKDPYEAQVAYMESKPMTTPRNAVPQSVGEEVPNTVAPVGLASQELGIPQDFTGDFTGNSVVKAALPLTAVPAHAPLLDTLKNLFEQNA